MLFDCSTDNIGQHLKNIFASGELVKDSVAEVFSATASDGKNYMTQFYNYAWYRNKGNVVELHPKKHNY